MDFILGFGICFTVLLVIGQIRKFFVRKAYREKSGTNEQIQMGEHVVAVLNSGTSQKQNI